ncbi:MAG TPA: dihydroorotate dehydrogenase [Vicinamibacteria bacterium]|nr:dihydroorotate dehydrogenase [Vicinamibacteria bacterium]
MSFEPDLRVEIAGIRFPTPLIAASGTFGYGTEYLDVADYRAIGGIVVKGLYMEPREGCAPPRIWETPSGMLNAIGLQEIGVERFVSDKMPRLRELGVNILVNICGSTIEEYGDLARILDDVEGVCGIELNISCPNVHEGGILFGCDPDMAARVTERVRQNTRLPVIPKLTPIVTDITDIARKVEAAGADALSLINTIPAMAIDVETRKPRLANVVGGLSGPAIRPIAIRLVYQAAQAVDVPIIGIGGISGHEDALEFFLAGASAVQIGTMSFVDPSVWRKTLDGLEDYCRRHRVDRLSALKGSLVADVKAVPTGW